jgi:membrane associated rhomboid family serine protease
MKQNLQQNLQVSVGIIILLWAEEIADVFLKLNLDRFGILPRQIIGLRGIFFAPFLHGGFYHLISNTIPLFILLMTMMTFYRSIWLQVTIFSALMGGLAVWAFARGGTVHIGASGVIFSLITFLLASGIFRKSFKSLLIAVAVFLFYGGVLWGVIPSNPYISWEGHLFGAAAGVFLAWIYRSEPAVEKTS